MKELEELVHNEEEDVREVNRRSDQTLASYDQASVSISHPPTPSFPPGPALDVEPRASFFTPPLDVARPRCGDFDQARDKAREVERLQSAGYARRKEGDFQGAIVEYSKAIEIDPQSFRSLFYRGFAFHSSGDFPRAIEDYTSAIAVDAANSFAFYNRGITRERVADLHGAIEDFTQAISLDPSSADSWHNRGYSHRRAGDLDAAIRVSQLSLFQPPCGF